METSESVNELAAALANAQAELSPVPFDSSNKFFNSRYASLSAVIAEVRKVLPKHGLSIVQSPTSHMEFGVFYVGVETMIIHVSGQWIKGNVSLPVVATELIEAFTRRSNRDGDAYYASPNILQEAGKVITYLRRYGIVSILMLSAEEDLDGNDVTQIPSQQARRESTEKRAVEKKAEAMIVDRPYTPSDLKRALKSASESSKLALATEKERSIVAAVLSQFAPDDNKRHEIQKFLFGVESIKDASLKMIAAAIRWLDPHYDPDDKEYEVTETVFVEIQNILEME